MKEHERHMRGVFALLIEQHGERSIKQLALDAGCSESNAGRILRKMNDEGLVHVARIVVMTRMWALGAGAAPLTLQMAVLAALRGRSKGLSTCAIAAAIRRSVSPVRRKLQKMNEEGLIYIVGFQLHKTMYMPMWALGNRPNAVRELMSINEKQKRYLERKKVRDPDAYDIILAKARARYYRNRQLKGAGKLKADAVTRALFGDLKVSAEEIAKWERQQAA